MPRARSLWAVVTDKLCDVAIGSGHHPNKGKSDFLFNIAEDPNELTNLHRNTDVMLRLQQMADDAVAH